jgi:O-antigen ligase
MPANIKYLLIIDIILISGIFLFRSALKPAFRDVIGKKQIFLTLLTPAMGLFSGNVYIFDLYLVLAVGLTSITRAELAATYIMMLPMVPALDVETGAGGVYLFAISAIFAINFGAFVGVLLTPRQRVFSKRNLDMCALILILIEMYIALSGSNLALSSITRAIIVNILGVGVPYFVISRCISSGKDLNKFLISMLFSGTLCAMIAVAQARLHWTLYEAINTSLHTPLAAGAAGVAMRGGLLRTGGPMIDYTAGGMFLACVLVVFAGMRSQFRPSWSIAIGGLMLAGLFVTQSRGAWVAMIAGWLVCMLYRGYIARSLSLFGVLAFLQVVLVPFFGSFSKNLGETLGTSGASVGTAEYRSQLLREGLQQIANHPLTGQAPDQLRAMMADLMQGQHIVDFVNTHLFVAMVAGLPGFTAWVLIWSTPVAMVWSNRPSKRTRKWFDPAETPMAIIMTAMVCLIFTSAIDRNLSWPVIALGLVGPCLAFRKMVRPVMPQPNIAFEEIQEPT